MKMTLRLWNSVSGSKGFIFSLDAVMAITLVTVLIATSIYMTRMGSDALPDIYVSRIGDDVVTVLDIKNIFDTMNKDAIESAMESMLPASYEMKINLNCTTKIIQTSKSVPVDRTIASGMRFVVTNNLDYCTARYWIWQE